MSATENVITTPQTIGWIVTGVGIAFSLAWNGFNYIRTQKIAEQLRAEQYRAGQWARLRNRIEGALDELVDASKAVVQQAQKLDGDSLETRIVGVFFLLLVDAQDKLASALEEANLSIYSAGENWCDAANGPKYGSETSWDNVLRIMAEAEAAASKFDAVEALKSLKDPIGEIRALVNERCRIQDLLLDPEKV
jgi:cellobiose-specific phosphotransferase system component IIA